MTARRASSTPALLRRARTDASGPIFPVRPRFYPPGQEPQRHEEIQLDAAEECALDTVWAEMVEHRTRREAGDTAPVALSGSTRTS